MNNKNIPLIIIQPFVAHYREDFFRKLSNYYDYKIVSVEPPKKNESFKVLRNLNETYISSFKIGKYKLFNPFNKFFKKKNTLVITWSPKWLTLYIILLFKSYFFNKIIIWTHGISIQNGFNPNTIRDRVKLNLYNKADGICFYTKKELKILKPHLNNPKLFFINNTLNVKKIQKTKLLINSSKEELRKKHGISTSRTVIYCARFTKHRRSDLLENLIDKMNFDDVSFIIIGNGPYKPNFNYYKRVYDYGSLYNDLIKAELFSISEFSFQPAWTGLSVVESFANGIPFITFKRAENIKQSVEYNYIKSGKNGFIIKDLNEAKKIIMNTSKNEIKIMKENSFNFARENLSLDNMVNNFIKGINHVMSS